MNAKNVLKTENTETLTQKLALSKTWKTNSENLENVYRKHLTVLELFTFF